jgi:uncharacterized protein YqgV (UPF0045/DUF77 family)
MQVTAEISLYPLTENFEQVVINYILELKKISGLKIEVNGLSTQIFGEYDLVMRCLTEINKLTFENNRCVILMKMAAGEKSIENLPQVLK